MSPLYLGEALGADLARQFESVFEAMHDGVWVCDTTPRLLWINTACETLNDIRREDVCGKTVAQLLTAGNFDTDVTTRVLRERRPVAINQKVKSGRTLLVNGVPVFDGQGQIIYVVGNERDLTELNLLREELEHTQAVSRRIHSELLALRMREADSEGIVAESEAMERVLTTALRVAEFDSTVLLTGPSGSGKSLLAKLLHDGSSRRAEPLLSLNCGAIPGSLIEAELFGYADGAFTGAQRGGKPGLLEAAEGGTLFLDEIDAFPLESQVKLLTFLDTRNFIRIGDRDVREVDVRLVAATNKNLSNLVDQGLFREDLWFRLNVVPISLPPLAERQADVAPLVHRCLEQLAKRHGVHRGIVPEAVALLRRYHYPGNVRELHNIIESCFVLCQSDTIELKDLPQHVRDVVPARSPQHASTLRESLQAVERDCLTEACRRHTRQHEIAAALGVSQPTVARLLRKHGVRAGGRDIQN